VLTLARIRANFGHANVYNGGLFDPLKIFVVFRYSTTVKFTKCSAPQALFNRGAKMNFMTPIGSSNPKTKMVATFVTCSSYLFIFSWTSAYIVKGETRAHRMWVNVLLVLYKKFNMATETGSRNNLHSSSEIDAV